MLKIIDASLFKMGRYVGEQGFYRKFKRYWGVDSNGYYSDRIKIWPRRTATTNKLLKLLGMYDEVVSMSPSGVTSVWLYMNPDKLNATLDNFFEGDVIEGVVEQEFELNKVYQIAVEVRLPEAHTDKSNKQLFQYIKSNWRTLGRGVNATSVGSDLVKTATMAKAFMADVSDDFDVQLDTLTRRVYTSVESDNYNGGSYTVTNLVVSIILNVKRIGSIQSDNSRFITEVRNMTRLEKEQMVRDRDNERGEDGEISYGFHRVTVTNSIFTNDMLDDNKLKMIDITNRLKAIQSCIDTGYAKKEAKWYHKVLVVVVVFASLWVCGPSCAAGTTAAIATAATVVALSLAITSMYIAKQGDYSAAKMAGNMSKIAGTIALIAGLANLANNIATEYGNEMARQKAAEEAARKAALEAGKEYTAKGVMSMAMESAWHAIRVGPAMTWNKAAGYANQAAQMYYKNRLEDINANMASRKEQQDAMRTEMIMQNDEKYEWSLASVEGNAYDAQFNQMAALQNERYYPEKDYQGTRFNVGRISPNWKSIGVFAADYDHAPQVLNR